MIKPTARVRMFFGHVWEKIRGPRTVIDVENNGILTSQLLGVTLRGVVINITCKQYVKIIHYDRWWVRDRVIHSYVITGSCDGEPPEFLRELFSGEMLISNVLTPWASQGAQREAAVSAYLDIVMSKLPSRGQKKIPTTA